MANSKTRKGKAIVSNKMSRRDRSPTPELSEKTSGVLKSSVFRELSAVRPELSERASEILNSPAYKELSALTSELSEQASETINSPAFKELGALKDAQRNVMGPYKNVMGTLELTKRIEHLIAPNREIASTLSHNVRLHTNLFGSSEQIKRLQARFAEYEEAIRPSMDALSALSANAAEAIKRYQEAFRPLLEKQQKMSERLSVLGGAWALPSSLEESVIGFAGLARVSEVVHSSQPFSREVGDFLEEQFGESSDEDSEMSPLVRDAVAIERGFNSQLIDFPPVTYSEITFAAGFRFSIVKPAAPMVIEGRDEGAVYDPSHAQLLLSLEQRLRGLIEQELMAHCGDHWERTRISGSIRNLWMGRQSEEREADRPVYSLIQYANFLELLDVITQRNNWDQVFKRFFMNKEDFQVSLRRLHPIRNAIAHSRPLSRSEVLYLLSESTRIFRALGDPVFE